MTNLTESLMQPSLLEFCARTHTHTHTHTHTGYYIAGREGYLNVIGEYMELHSTFKETFPSTPKHIVNDGLMSQVDVQR